MNRHRRNTKEGYPSTLRLSLERLEDRCMLNGGPIITEFMASNDNALLDGNDKSSDWIEIFNPTDAPVALTDWYLSDDAADLSAWKFPDVTLAPSGDPFGNDYLIVFASGKDDGAWPYYDGTYYHTNFKLSTNGDNQHESALLVRPDGSTIEHGYEDYPLQVTDISYGVFPGTTYGVFVETGSPLVYHVPSSADATLVPDVGGDEGWTAKTFDDSSWTDWRVLGAADVIITEINTGDTDFVEIQNASSNNVTVTGWSVLVNDPAGGINAVNGTAWQLSGTMAAGDILYRTDNPADQYWQSDIAWEVADDGWAMIIDDAGDIRDFVVWGYDAGEIASLTVDYGSFTNITVGSQWTGDGAQTGTDVGGGGTGGGSGDGLSYVGGTYFEDFNSMGANGTAPPVGWTAGKYSTTQNRQPPGSSPSDDTLYVDDGSATTKGRSYNYGTDGDSDRAIGHLPTTDTGDRSLQLAISPEARNPRKVRKTPTC